ncbi:hypothetical protein HME9302_00303 [Alteripontixanthobacter maritimus]|uniref:HTH tetR-type domain-containing protein n=1 Tax=Alteripontixanthobacter maritimus TaxID=2161824 RepID=A0A369QA02_9SPHN|nr:TetR/AcrR family transcriptional regulator [Alteripontixanthobacter maritimus]RDC59118.1 hypothetical protein HME9302_00303 [Alteripontixanthobacter maritimus]
MSSKVGSIGTGSGKVESDGSEYKDIERRSGRPTDLAKRAAIISAASHSFFEHGYGDSSIERIAADADVSKVTVYNHFGNKRALFSAAVEAECEKMRSHLLFDDHSGPLRERLVAFGHAMLAFLARPQMIRFEHRIAAETEREPELGIAFLDAGPRRMHSALSGLIARAADRGELVVDDPDTAAEQLASMVKGLGDLERRFAGTVDEAAAIKRVDNAVDAFLKIYGV